MDKFIRAKSKSGNIGLNGDDSCSNSEFDYNSVKKVIKKVEGKIKENLEHAKKRLEPTDPDPEAEDV